MTKEESIEKVINNHFDTLEDKVDNIKEKLVFEKEYDISDPNLKIKLQNAEIQINKILQTYDKLSKNELTLEEKYIFATYLVNIFNKANNILTNLLEIKSEYERKYDMYYTANLYNTFNINKEKIVDALELLQSSDIHNKVIGIDNFMSLAHTNSTLLPELISLINGVTVLHIKEIDDEILDYYFDWRNKVDENIVKKLNEIRERKGLSRFKYENM